MVDRFVRAAALPAADLDAKFDEQESAAASINAKVDQAIVSIGVLSQTVDALQTPDASAVQLASGQTVEQWYAAVESRLAGQTGSAPSITSVPTIAPTDPVVGQEVTATTGTVSGGTGSQSNLWQWNRVDDTGVSTPIIGETNSTYTVTSDLVGYRISVTQVVLDDVDGVSNPKTSAVSDAIPAVTNAPTNTTAPAINPTTVDTDGTLIATRGAYLVNGVAVDNATLTFTERWTVQWAATAVFSGGETSCTLTAVWGGTTGTYDIYFSNGDTKNVTLTNNSASVSWTGGLSGSATTAIEIEVQSSGTSLILNDNNADTPVHYYETPTGAGGTGDEVEASNTVTPTLASGVAAGHYYLETISASLWSELDAQMATWSDPNRATVQARYAAIPTSGGVTLNNGATWAQIQSAMSANSVVFLGAGTYVATGELWMGSNKWLVGVAGATVNIDVTGIREKPIYMSSGCSLVNLNFIGPTTPGSAGAQDTGNLIVYSGGNHFFYKIKTYRPYGTQSYHYVPYNNTGNQMWVSCEMMNGYDTGQNGENADGLDIGVWASNQCTMIDCHTIENADDGFDTWQTLAAQRFYYCSARKSGKNQFFPSAVGNGNGFKLGLGNAQMYLYKCWTDDNKSYGFLRNGNTTAPILVGCYGSGDDLGLYGGGAGQYVIS